VPKSPSTAAPAGPAVSPPAGEQKSDGSKMATDVSQHTPQASVETASTNPASTAAAAPSSAETLAAIASGRRSCVEVISGALAAVAATNGKLNGCIEVLGEPALAAARAVDAKVAATEPLGKLAGLPIVVKANIDVDGSLSTAATPALKDWRPSTNATVVQALVDAGAIVVAKTNMPEFAQRGDGWCSLHGNCLNPTNPTRSSGGSSSGTAVAVAARYVTVGLGSDTAGSTRIPAACCGIVGMRPSRGRWPSAGCIPLDDYKVASNSAHGMSCMSNVVLESCLTCRA
jgi:Asp-tRNA(Asn)/Glu-tRNA(Gln) amidotransferase A subunit family amidase